MISRKTHPFCRARRTLLSGGVTLAFLKLLEGSADCFGSQYIGDAARQVGSTVAQARFSVRKIREVLRLNSEARLSDRQIAAVLVKSCQRKDSRTA